LFNILIHFACYYVFVPIMLYHGLLNLWFMVSNILLHILMVYVQEVIQ